MVGFFTCYGSANLQSSLSWRLPFILLASLSFIFAAASVMWLTPSPRWLTLRGRSSEAAATWDILEVGQAEREKAEIEQNQGPIELQTQGPSQLPPVSTDGMVDPILSGHREPKSTFWDLFSRDVRMRTALAVFMMGMQQFSGIDGVLYVSLTAMCVRVVDTNAQCSTHPSSSNRRVLHRLKRPF